MSATSNNNVNSWAALNETEEDEWVVTNNLSNLKVDENYTNNNNNTINNVKVESNAQVKEEKKEKEVKQQVQEEVKEIKQETKIEDLSNKRKCFVSGKN